ncbi:uncharacterized protein LOC114597433 [Podarcis muralis]
MEQRDSKMHPAASLLKDRTMFCHNEKPTDAGQCHLSRSRSWRRRRSNSFTICTLPSIPEYPGFQDVKNNYSRGSNSCFTLLDLGRTRFENPPNRTSDGQVRNLGNSAVHFAKGHSKTKSSVCDQSLQDYFSERLLKLRNYETKTSNGKVKVYLNENQNPSYTSKGLRRRSTCSAMIQANHMKLTEKSRESVDPVNEYIAICSNDHSDTQNIEDCSQRRSYLESLTLSINGPLEMLVRRT